MNAAEVIVWVLGVYAIIGVGFGVYFGFAGSSRLDDSAKGAGIGFGLLMIPGAAALWPLLAVRLVKGGKAPEEVNSHRRLVRKEKGE